MIGVKIYDICDRFTSGAGLSDPAAFLAVAVVG